jgi:hypothetical protein
LSEREAVEFCLYEIPDPKDDDDSSEQSDLPDGGESNERTALLGGPSSPTSANGHESHSGSRPDNRRTGSSKRTQLMQSLSRLTMSLHADADDDDDDDDDDPTAPFIHLNALEIAAIADAKRFLSQHVVQKIITGIWSGEIIFWDRLSASSVKKPRFYNSNTSDPFCRLRVPKYLKTYEVIFFAAFLFLYYAVLIEQNRYQITPFEVLLYIWFAAFFYDEISEYIDAGSIFYTADIWNLFDMIMIAIGIVFAIMSTYLCLLNTLYSGSS